MVMENYRDNLEIDLKDLVRYILRFWKSIILFAIIGTLLGGGCGYLYSDKPEVKQEASAEPALSDAELQRVNAAVETYRTYQKIHETVQQNVNADIEKIDASGEIDKDTAESLEYKTEILSMVTSGQFAGEQSVYNSLNANEKEAYDELIGRKNKEETQGGRGRAKTVMLPFAGCIFGAFIVIAILVVRYLLSPMLKTEDDLRSAFRLPVLGSIVKKNDDGLAVICSSIMALASTGRAKNILLCSSLSQGSTPDYISRIKDFLKEKAVSAEAALNIISDPASIDKISGYDGLVFFESIGESTYENIAKEVELSGNLGINILGTVVVK